MVMFLLGLVMWKREMFSKRRDEELVGMFDHIRSFTLITPASLVYYIRLIRLMC